MNAARRKLRCWRAHLPLVRESDRIKIAISRLMNYTAARALVVDHARRGGGVGFVDRDERAFHRARRAAPVKRAPDPRQLELQAVADG
jgi:hypothetical protein